jgi:hypothetical protein
MDRRCAGNCTPGIAWKVAAVCAGELLPRCSLHGSGPLSSGDRLLRTDGGVRGGGAASRALRPDSPACRELPCLPRRVPCRAGRIPRGPCPRGRRAADGQGSRSLCEPHGGRSGGPMCGVAHSRCTSDTGRPCARLSPTLSMLPSDRMPRQTARICRCSAEWIVCHPGLFVLRSLCQWIGAQLEVYD